MRRPGGAAVERKILAQDTNWQRLPSAKLMTASHWLPKTAQIAPRQRLRPGVNEFAKIHNSTLTFRVCSDETFPPAETAGLQALGADNTRAFCRPRRVIC